MIESPFIDERRELVKRHAPECLDRKDERGRLMRRSSEFTEFFGDPKVDPLTYRRQGYIPVLDESMKAKTQVTDKGDPLYKRPRELFIKDRRRGEELSRRTVEGHLEANASELQREGFTTDIPPGGD